MFAVLKKLIRDESGQDFAEYAIAVAVIAGAGVAAVTLLMTAYNTVFTDVGTAITAQV